MLLGFLFLLRLLLNLSAARLQYRLFCGYPCTLPPFCVCSTTSSAAAHASCHELRLWLDLPTTSATAQGHQLFRFSDNQLLLPCWLSESQLLWLHPYNCPNSQQFSQFSSITSFAAVKAADWSTVSATVLLATPTLPPPLSSSVEPASSFTLSSQPAPRWESPLCALITING